MQPTPTASELLAEDLPRRGKAVVGTRDSHTSATATADPEPVTDVNRPAMTGTPTAANLKPVELDDKAANPPATPPQPAQEIAETTMPHRRTVPTGPHGLPAQATVARLEGRSLHFPSNAGLAPGTRFEIGPRSYEIKSEESFRLRFWAKTAGVFALTILAAIGIAYLLSGDPGAPIMGVVVNAQSGEIIPNAMVSMANGQSVRTNQAGLYLFDRMDAGQYVIKASAPGFEPQNGFIETEAGITDQISFALTPIFAAVAPETDSAKTADMEKTDKSAGKSSASSSNRSFGSVELLTDFEGYLVFVDGEIYGKNPKKLKRLRAGEHKIMLQKDGYQDFVKVIKVKERATAKLKIAKADLTPKIDPIKRSRGHFAEGRNYLNRRNWIAAIHEFDQAIDYVDDYAEAYQYRGWAYLKSDNPAAATRDFVQAAQLYDASKRYIDAISCVGYLLELDPKNAAYWRLRADYNLALTDYKDAIADYKKAVKIDKKSLENRMALAEAYYAAGRFHDAAKEFDRARKLSDDPSDAYVRMILAYYYAGENDDVLKKYREFSEVAPPERIEELRDDPEWLRVLQIIGPDERTKN